MVEHVTNGDCILAIILRADYHADGIEFFTPNGFSQQLAYMNRPAGYEIQPHRHNPVPRRVHFTQEVLFVRKGRVRVDFYDDNEGLLTSRELRTGDVILLASGGHGFTMLEQTELIEVKQGPYPGEEDKTRFTPRNCTT